MAQGAQVGSDTSSFWGKIIPASLSCTRSPQELVVSPEVRFVPTGATSSASAMPIAIAHRGVDHALDSKAIVGEM